RRASVHPNYRPCLPRPADRPVRCRRTIQCTPDPSSDVELLVDGNAVLAAIRLVMVDEPPDVECLHESSLLVVELNRALQPAEQLHPFRMIADQRVHETRGLVDEVTGPRDP